MSVKAVMRPRGDQVTVAVEAQADSRPEPSLIDTISAGFRTAKDEVPFIAERRIAEAYDPVIRAVTEVTGKSRWSYVSGLQVLNPFDGDATDYDAVWRDIAATRARDPKAFPDLPADRAAFERAATSRGGARAGDLDTLNRGGAIAGMIGGVGAQAFDPVNTGITIATGGAGAARSIAWGALREAGINVGAEVIETPMRAKVKGELGEEFTARDAAVNIASAGAFGAAFHTGARGVAAGIDKLTPRDLKLARALDKAVPSELRTPEQQAAIHVLEREADLDASNPYARTYDGADAHAARLEAIIADFHEPHRAAVVVRPADAVTPREPGRSASAGRVAAGGSLDGTVVAGLRKRGFSEHQARGIAAGIHAESRSDPNVRGGYKGRALGIGQWLGERRAEIIRRYGEAPTLDQQLDFLAEELRGRDAGGAKVLAQGDESAVLRSYIEDFMRPAKGAQTSGDLARGMAALGRGGEAPALSEASLAGIDVGEGGQVVRPAELDAVRPTIDEDPLVLRPEVVDEALVTGLRGLVADPLVSLNRLPELASALDASEEQVGRALARLADQGAITITKSGQIRRAGSGGVNGPDDALRFIARSGGISYDGLNDASRNVIDASRGHDLRNTGNLAAFIPGGGPLLRPKGRSLDEVGEALWDAGYLGPPENTPRPTESEVIEFLDQSLRTKQKRYSFFDTAPEAKAPAADIKGPPELDAPDPRIAENAIRAHWDAAAENAGTVPLFPHEIAATQRIMAEGTDVLPALASDPLPPPEVLAPYVVEMVNREIDDILEASYLEVEDPRYDTFLSQFADRSEEAGGAAGGGGGSALERGNADEGGQGAQAGERDYPDELSPAERDAAEAAGELPATPFDEPTLKTFDDPVGAAAAKAADDAWHDIKSQLVDPNAAAVQRDKVKLGAASPMRGKVEQDGTGGLGLFDTANEPTFDLGDGQGPRKLSEIDAELEADKAAIDTIESCML